MGTLIVPCAGRSTRFPGVRPKWMLTYPDGKLMIQKSIEGLLIKNLERIIITIVKEHCDKFDADIWLKNAIGNDIEICILDAYTSSQSETVSLTINKMNVSGGFISKDSDGYVEVEISEFENFLVGADLKKNMEVSNVAGKSFIILNEQNMVNDIIEKSVCSNIINIGVYGFSSAQDFLEAQEVVKQAWNSAKSEIYLSHVVSYMIGQGSFFSYKEAVNYEDWGLLSDWNRSISRKKTYFIDIDGVVFKNKGRYGKVNWSTADVPLENNVKTIKKIAEKGGQIIFCTARVEQYREKVEQSLRALDISWHSIVMGCNHSQRVLINDYSNTNPYPSCTAINLQRDSDTLEDYIL